ncbi:MAG: hypothetical protein ACOYLH_05810 [Flavobacteriales bacterium]|jgi:hypothetical protein
MFRFILFVLLGITLQANAQKTTTHSVKLFSGDMFEGTRLIYSSPILKKPIFELDGTPYESNTVAFFQNNHGYFANLTALYGEKSERYALRTRQGKINIFEEVDLTAYAGDELETGEDGDNENLASGKIFGYYTKGDGAIKKAKYSNLKLDLADNEEAMKELRAYRNFKWLQAGLVAAGAGILAYDIYRQKDQPVSFSVMMAVGICVGGSSYFVESKKDDALWLAADAYNR